MNGESDGWLDVVHFGALLQQDNWLAASLKRFNCMGCKVHSCLMWTGHAGHTLQLSYSNRQPRQGIRQARLQVKAQQLL
jgi:hypothetical protein